MRQRGDIGYSYAQEYPYTYFYFWSSHKGVNKKNWTSKLKNEWTKALPSGKINI